MCSTTSVRSSTLVQSFLFALLFFVLLNPGIAIHGKRVSRSSRVHNAHSNSHGHGHHHHGADLRSVPRVGAFLKDFKGVTVRVIKEVKNSYVVLPHLKVGDHLWEDFSIQLNCSFHQPIHWIYEGQGAPVVKTDTYRNAPDIKNASTYTYGATVKFSFTHFKQTGRYICESIEDPKIQSSIFAFVPGEKIFVKNDETEENNQSNSTTVSTSTSTTITIYGDALSQWIRLPCTVSNPNVSVQLFKDGHEIHVSRKRVYFDPSTGFEIYKDALKHPWGEYECYEQNSNESLKIHVMAPEYILQEVFQMQDENKVFSYNENDNAPKHNVHIKFHYDKRNEILACCAYDIQGNRLNDYPMMKSLSCDSTSECRMLERHLDAMKCPGSSCEGKKLKRNCIGYELTDFNDAGIIQCSLGENTGEYYQFSKVGQTVITKFDYLPQTKDILSIAVENSKKPNKKIFTCLANSFFFSHGIKWAFRSESQQIQFLDEEYPSKISVELGPEDADEIYCFAPLWNSNAWRNVSMLYTES